MYIEGVKDGRRFFRTLKEVARKKPVLIWKGGMTQAGTRATASHTGQLAESATVWEAVIRQCGAIKVDSLDEMVDAIKALLYIKPTAGIRVGLIAMTGGQSVVITDTFARAGLEVPLLTEKSYQQFASWFTVVGGSYKNPLDVSSNFFRAPDPLGNLLKMLNTLDADENVDIVVLELSVAFMAGIQQRDPQFLGKLTDLLANFKERSPKSFLVILIAGHREAGALDIRDHLMKAGIPGYPSFDRGARALKKATDYYRFLKS
jgi:acyl-CoA synthetase (NDP forming)